MIDNFRRYCRASSIPLAAMFVSLFVSSVAIGQDHDGHADHMEMKQTESGAIHVNITPRDATLITQDGTEVNLSADLIGDRIVVIDFIYTTCTTVCPVLSAVFKQVQKKLGGRVGDDVIMLSVSVDPLRDTPARMKAYADKFGAGDGWLWLTGRKQTITQVLEDFGAYTPNFEEHPSMILVGDGSNGQWARFLGFPGVDKILGKVDEFTISRIADHKHTAVQEKQ